MNLKGKLERRISDLEERLDKLMAQCLKKSPWKMYSLNVGIKKVESSKKIIMKRYKIPEEYIRVKQNKYGNYAIHYKLEEEK